MLPKLGMVSAMKRRTITLKDLNAHRFQLNSGHNPGCYFTGFTTTYLRISYLMGF